MKRIVSRIEQERLDKEEAERKEKEGDRERRSEERMTIFRSGVRLDPEGVPYPLPPLDSFFVSSSDDGLVGKDERDDVLHRFLHYL